MPRTPTGMLGVVVAVILVVGVVPTAAAATPDSPPPTPTEANSTQPTGTRIDSGLRLVSASYDGSGTATLTFYVEEAKAVTLADAGGFIDGGHINRRTFVFEDTGRHTVTFAVTESPRGYVGVSIATNQVLYAKVIKAPSPSPFAGASGTVGWLGGASIVALSFVGAAGWKLRREGGTPMEAEP